MDTVESDCPIPDEERTVDKAHQIASNFVTGFTDLSLPTQNADVVEKR